MRLSSQFTRTRRETPAGLDLPGQQFLARAGYIQSLSGNRQALLPLGQMCLDRIAGLFIPALQELGAQQLFFPGDGVEGLSELAKGHLRSHRQLPALLYRWTSVDEEMARRGSGLLTARGRPVLEVFHLNQADQALEALSAEINMALVGPLARLGLAPQGGLGDAGPGGDTAQDWLYAHPAGEEGLLCCEACGYAAVPAAASFTRAKHLAEAPRPLEKVATPDCKSIADLARFLQIPESGTAKAVFFTAIYAKPEQPTREELIFAVVRGDREVNETAVQRLTGCQKLLPAPEEAIRSAGATPGYASPLGVKGVRVIVDREIPTSPNLVAGANEAGYHLRNVNYGRDYSASEIGDIALAQAGSACPECGGELSRQPGFTLLHSRRLSVSFAQERGLDFLDESGRSLPARLEYYRLEAARLMGCLAEAHHDSYGLKMPIQAAPLPLHLVILPGKEGGVETARWQVEDALRAAGIEALVDDRPESAGVKFNDADLIGLPLRATIGERSLKQGGVELRRRGEAQGRIVAVEELVNAVLTEQPG